MSWEPIDPNKPDENEVIGDEPFDIISEALDKVVSCYEADLQRKPTTKEIVKTFEKVLAPRFFETVAEGGSTELVGLSFKTKRIPARQHYKAGDFLKAEAANGQHIFGRVFEVGRYGPLIGVYDSLGLESPSLPELKRLRLVIKVTPIHKELMEKRAWVVIGHLAIDRHDDDQPRGPIAISGFNEQLNAANFYYKLPHRKRYGMEEMLND